VTPAPRLPRVPRAQCPRVAPKMRLPAVSEREFRAQIVGPNGLATMLGWLHVGFRPAQTAHGWRTPVTGELGEGWPDLVLAHPHKGRLMFREVKRVGERPTPAQFHVLSMLRLSGADASWWSPADLDSGRIVRELGG